MKFDIRQTNIAKGIAVLLLLWHHVFLGKGKLYVSLFPIGNAPVEQWLAEFAKCCVAMFMFLSGYGLYKSFCSFQKKQDGKSPLVTDAVFIKNRIIKLMMNYWVVFIIFVPLGLFFGRKFYEVYGSNPLHYIANFLGLSYLFYQDDFTMNATWWYVSEILVFYMLYPLMFRIYGKIRGVLVVLAGAFCIIPGVFRGLNIYLYVLLLGTLFAAEGIFEKCDKLLNQWWKRLLPLLLLIPLGAVRYYLNGKNMVYAMKFDGIFILPIILISYLVISKIPYLNRVLEELGKRSGLIFLFHTFICGYYFKKYLYSLKYSLFIFFVMLVVSYLLALGLEWLMKGLKINQLTKKLTA